MRIVGGEFRGRPLAAPRTQRYPPDHRPHPRGGVQRARASFRRPAGRRARARPVCRHRRARPRGVVARRRLLHVHRGIGRGPGPDPRQCRGLRPAPAAPRSSGATRRGSARPATIQPFDLRFRRSALWQGAWRDWRLARRGPAVGWTPGALCVVEEAASAPFAPGRRASRSLDERNYGETVIRFLEAGLIAASVRGKMTNNSLAVPNRAAPYKAATDNWLRSLPACDLDGQSRSAASPPEPSCYC